MIYMQSGIGYVACLLISSELEILTVNTVTQVLTMTIKSTLETINRLRRGNILRQGIPKVDSSESKNIGPQHRFTVSFLMI